MREKKSKEKKEKKKDKKRKRMEASIRKTIHQIRSRSLSREVIMMNPKVR
jgi:hypothetical protein